MNSIFGDATSVMPTPQTLAEAESLFSGSARSPVPSLDIRSNRAADNAIPNLDINPPETVGGQDGKSSSKEADQGEGIGGWISNIVKKSKGNGEGDSGKYRRIGQDDNDE